MSLSTPKKTKVQSQKATADAELRKELALTYKLFSRKKYQKYKHQFPRLKQSELVHKIIREWQSLSKQEKLQLKRTYTQEKEIKSQQQNSDKDDHSEKSFLSSKKSKKQKSEKSFKSNISDKQNSRSSIKIIINVKGKGKETTSNNKDIFQDDLDKSKQDKFWQSDDQSIFGQSQPQSIGNKVKTQKVKTQKKQKKKRIRKSRAKSRDLSKLKNGKYLTFYKYYFNKLQKEHPKWTSQQITNIAKLLWRKNTLKQKKVKQNRIKLQGKRIKLPSKPLSGKSYFVRQMMKKRIIPEQIKLLWNRLPKQSKLDWEKRGAALANCQHQNIVIQVSSQLQKLQIIRKKSQQIEGQQIRSEQIQGQQIQGKLIQGKLIPKKIQAIKPQQRTSKRQVITFKNLLLRGSTTRQPQINVIKGDQIATEQQKIKREQKSMTSSKKQEKFTSKAQQKQNSQFIRHSNFGFMRNKILLEK